MSKMKKLSLFIFFYFICKIFTTEIGQVGSYTYNKGQQIEVIIDKGIHLI